MKGREDNMNDPFLAIMAAGMGSRYGSLKQMDPVDEQGHLIIDFSLHDAYRAGFRKVIFIIKPEIEQDFKTAIGNRISKFMQVSYVFQKIDDLPKGFSVPEGRTKPWGTGHAILSCASIVDAPFAVINADDYYGLRAFETIFQFLRQVKDTRKYHYAMVGYQLENTLTDFGSVARGICKITQRHMLESVTERTRIEKHGFDAVYTEDDGETWLGLPLDTTVSMNLWGFTPSIFPELDSRFSLFLDNILPDNPLKGEYFLPIVVSSLIHERKADVKVLDSPDKWYGVTYKEDKKAVVSAISKMKRDGIYPINLWENYKDR